MYQIKSVLESALGHFGGLDRRGGMIHGFHGFMDSWIHGFME